MVIFLPSLLPFAPVLGLGTIHFAALIVINLVIGLSTPPVGILLFVVANIGNIPLVNLSRSIMPFLIGSIFAPGLLIFFPALTTWLPARLAQGTGIPGAHALGGEGRPRAGRVKVPLAAR